MWEYPWFFVWEAYSSDQEAIGHVEKYIRLQSDSAGILKSYVSVRVKALETGPG